nr:sel1 repeat family protein [Rhizobium sp. Q54]
MTGPATRIGSGLWLVLALASTGQAGNATETAGKDAVSRPPAIAQAYRQLGDLFRDGTLPPRRAQHIERFLGEARQASGLGEPVAVVNPASLAERTPISSPDGRRAASAYQVAGRLGDPEALVRLGELYREGKIVPKDLPAAFTYFSRARDLGYPSARWRLADMMLRGEGVAIDPQAARAELEVAAEEGVPTAMLMLGDLHASGELGRIDAAAAVSAWQGAVDKGDIRGLTRLAGLYDRGRIVARNAAKAYDLFTEAGSKGDVFASVSAARMLISGDGVAADRARGLAQLEALSATAGADGKVALADFYSTRDQSGDKFDLRRAYALYAAAANEGSRSARLRMAVMQVHGEGTGVDHESGISILRAMAAEGHAPAAYALGNIFGFGPPELLDAKAAIAAYEQAHDLGEVRATILLGDIFSAGDLVPRQPAKALQFYRSASLENDIDARLKADELVVRDTGTQEEALVALRDIEKLAETGSVDAIVLLGDLMRTGRPGVIGADEAKALKNYLAAAQKGNQAAALRAGEILVSGAPEHRELSRGVEMMLSVAKVDASAYLVLGDALARTTAPHPGGLITAKEAFERAGAAGLTTAYLKLGDLYRDGRGVQVDGVKAARYYSQAAGLQEPGGPENGF